MKEIDNNMRAIIETLTGIRVSREIKILRSPMSNIRLFYEADEQFAIQIFTYPKVAWDFMEGKLDEQLAYFALINVDGDKVVADWNKPLCYQPIIMEELERINLDGQLPTFIACVGSII